MSFEAHTNALLEASTPLLALVPKEKITFGTAHADEKTPCVVLYRISTTPTLSTDNGQPGSATLDKIRLQVSVWARDSAEVNTIAKLIRRILEASRPTIYVLQEQKNGYEDDPDVFSVIQEYDCWHPDTVPA